VTAQAEARPLLLLRAITASRRPNLLGELLIVFILLRVYDMVRAQAAVRKGPALEHGEAILSLERWMRIDVELATNLWVTSHERLSLLCSHIYQFAHVSVTLSVLAWCWWRRPELYRTARNALVVINVVGLTVFLLLPVAPPRLLPGYGFVDSVANAGFGTTHGGPIPADQYGALPSLHLAWAVWSTVIAMRLLAPHARRGLCWLYPVTITVIVVVTANHYLLDAAAGTAVALGALGLVRAGTAYLPALPRLLTRPPT
jgi:hypothetical protein